MCRVALFVVLLYPGLLVAEDAPKVLTPAEAAKKIDEKVTVELEVKSTGGGRGAIFLNSATDFRSPDNFAIVIFRSNLERYSKADIGDPAVYYKGKTIQVTGTVVRYRDQLEIKADDPDQIRVVDKSAEPKATNTARPVKKAPKVK